MIISPAKAFEAATVLCVELDTLTADELRRAYRDKAKSCHPDHHGNSKLECWARVSWAKECLGHWLQQKPAPSSLPIVEGTCRACGGSGRVKLAHRQFGPPLTMACLICKGLGTVEPEEDDHD